MRRPEQIILITGAPRSGTTPVGDLLARLPRTRMLYEPMGPNGDTDIPASFAIPGSAEFAADDLGGFINRMAARTLRMSGVTRRKPNTAKMSLIYKFLGTQAQHSYRKYRFDPFVKTLVWKDPFAAFCAEHGAMHGFRAVMPVRPPLAHAASFKRMGWVSRVAEVYPRYAETFGPLEGFADHIAQFGETPLGSGALMWRLIHARFATMPKAERNQLFLLDMEALGMNELAGYVQVFDWLDLEMPSSVQKLIAKRASGSDQRQGTAGQVHDFERSAKSTNMAWKSTLSDDEVEVVNTIVGTLWDQIPFDNH